MALIVLFGAVGCLARWCVEEVVERRVLSHRPFATMGVNAAGALVAGLIVGLSRGAAPLISDTSALYGELMTGFCGGFTTFSSALAIPYLDFHTGRRHRGVGIIAGTLALCVVGYVIGTLFARI